MTPQREWFYEYEKYDGGDILFGYESPTKIVRWAKVWILLRDGRRTLPSVLNILGFARNLIVVSKTSDESVHTVVSKDSYKMVSGVMVLMRGSWIGMLHKLLGRIDSIIVSEVNETSSSLVKMTTLWHWRLGHIGEKSIHAMHKGMVDEFLDSSSRFNFCEHYVFVQ